jgi:hypothetical protein
VSQCCLALSVAFRLSHRHKRIHLDNDLNAIASQELRLFTLIHAPPEECYNTSRSRNDFSGIGNGLGNLSMIL